MNRRSVVVFEQMERGRLLAGLLWVFMNRQRVVVHEQI